MNQNETYLLWNCNECHSKSMGLIGQISEKLKLSISGMVFFANDPVSIPADANDLGLVMPLSIRFGEYAFYDAIVDIITLIKTQNEHFNLILISNSSSIWISLFMHISPDNLIFVSSENPESALDFSFLPSSTHTKVLQWPKLIPFTHELNDDLGDFESQYSQFQGNSSNSSPKTLKSRSIEKDSDYSNPTEDDLNSPNIHEEEEEISHIYQKSSHYSRLNLSGQIHTKPERETKTQIPQPLRTSQIQTSRYGISGDNSFNVPIKFQPLVEAMKAAGKAMISLNDLENNLKNICAELNISQPNTTTIINKANDAGIIIYDKSIKYVRFRNRAMANGTINYV